ncbi:DNA-binding CsgD family transcriptional regulator [Actinoplanes octamycinicus]|uniref:DNA-binding CsgD family transcriptional regulator n=1 Tax=Actinoplanes octamycinicus TaxID=135948 RepID=A0A7W7GZS1_9ACTN|nr:LuxR C-terminal-related transcriptional regulator [Actinoplanes octamycinicus]MBB4741309.1 DNA-binding CsgD family transcriptional regulator [Actinoplanes octamycinicus]GIE62891.1 hypothetical protein Aoc01nite_82930 [Actinoplanes octamycinicus]
MSTGPRFRFDQALADVYGDLRLTPVLRRTLRHTQRLTGSAAASVSLIDADHGRYLKAAEYGASCRLGQTFPLDEGATGRAVALRRPVVIPDYARLRSGHLAGANPGRAVAVPIWWRGEVIAVTVAFGTPADLDVDELEAFVQSVAGAIVESRRRAPVHAGGFPGAPFTPRETDVLALLRSGRTDREIAARLVLSPRTVEKHVAAILRKTGAGNRTAAVLTAMDNGWMGEITHTRGASHAV